MNQDVPIFSVYEVTCHLKQVIETQIEPLYVSGEISNYVHHSSGHIYFNLKDENATLRCTFFRGQNYSLDFKPADGMQVICLGKLTVFEKGGSYNLNVRSMTKAGKGMLQQQFEALKKKLLAEGLFDAEHKKPLPRYPQKIGIVTSATGAAIQDIGNILTRRFPVLALVFPALVQGNEAPAQLKAGIEYFNRIQRVDVIIITRGGGSQEDLFCFNDESLARAVFASRIPVISAVGHEIDFTICDFVADLRAPTPSAAAELVVPDRKELLGYLEAISRRMNLLSENRLSRLRESVQTNAYDLQKYHPEKIWQSYQMRFDLACLEMMNFPKNFRRQGLEFQNRQEVIMSLFRSTLDSALHKGKEDLHNLAGKQDNIIQTRFQMIKSDFEQVVTRFEQNSPLHILSKGYAIVHKTDKIVKSSAELQPGDDVLLTFSDGEVGSRITDKKTK